MKNWNSVFNFVMEIKQEYIKRFGGIVSYNLEQMIQQLNIEKYNNFAENVNFTHYKNWVLVKYNLIKVDRAYWEDPNSVYRESRSVVIDLEAEELVLTPFPKFFNLNEIEETKLENVIDKIKYAKSVEISNKLDGSMQQARYYKGEYVMSGSSALDPLLSFRLTEGYEMLTDSHRNMLKDCSTLTFIFEYISMKDRHVVNYKNDYQGLKLIGIRDSIDGHIKSYKTVLRFAEHYNVPCVEVYNNLTLNDILETQSIYSSDEKEGWVINIDNYLIKLKCDDYVNIHRLLSSLSSINVIIESIANNKYDDLISKVPTVYRERVQQSADQIFKYLKDTAAAISDAYDKAPKDNRKDFMIWVDNNAPKDIIGYVKCIYLNKPYHLLKTSSGNGYVSASRIGIVSDFKPLED